jgi:hypothetical protein
VPKRRAWDPVTVNRSEDGRAQGAARRQGRGGLVQLVVRDETWGAHRSESHCLVIHSLTNRSTRRLASLMAFDGTLVID